MSDNLTKTTEVPQDLVIKAELVPNLNVLISAIHVAQNKGAFTLGDASLIHKALSELISSFPQAKTEEKEGTAA